MNEHLLIGTPAYNGMVHIDYVHSLMSIGQSGITFTLMSLGGESLITRARNAMLSQFYHNETFSHLLFLDGDIRISGASVRRLIDHHRDVIGAPVPLKQNLDEPRVFNLAGAEKPIDGLSPVTRIGTAVFMLSRQAAKALVEDAMQSGSVYRAGKQARRLADDMELYDVFQVGVREGEYLSEDFWVCARLRDLGFEIYADLTIRTKHYGMFDFSELNKFQQ